MLWSLVGKKCVITGASQGIGFAIARRFYLEGASVCMVGRSSARMDQAVHEIRESGKSGYSAPGYRQHEQQQQDKRPLLPPQGHICDVSHGQQGWIDLFTAHPDVHVLVNCAGVTQNGLLTRVDDDAVASILETNLRGAVWGCKHASKRMVSSGNRQGCIINVSSLLALKGRSGTSVYAASKAGLLGLTTSLSQELGRWGIRVNALVPGYIDTHMIQGLSRPDELKQKIPLGRFGHVDEVADAAAFLAKNPYASNCILNLDGGLSAT